MDIYDPHDVPITEAEFNALMADLDEANKMGSHASPGGLSFSIQTGGAVLKMRDLIGVCDE